MINHLILPGVPIQKGLFHPAFEQYLREWHEQVIKDADDGLIAASICLQSVFIDLVLEGRVRHDWLSIMDDLLTNAGHLIAYSISYGKKLHNFDAQYLQSTIHSIHTRWWIEKLLNPERLDHEKYASLILTKKSTNGLIYDAEISKTILRHRMKAELSMSAAMGVEILLEAGKLNDALRNELSISLCDPLKVPPCIYITSEQFRLAALQILKHEEQFPAGIEEKIEACTEGLPYGWNDFPIMSKVDAYMGTAKRTTYDKPIHSPLVACHVAVLSKKVEEQTKREEIMNRLNVYSKKLAENPLDIPAFQMRDIPIPFGADLTPIEAICTSWLIANLKNNGKQR
jgi:hypothetical protein